MAHPSLVVTCTPLRISFAGGGTDLPGFYEQRGGAVLSTTIDQYLYVTVKRHGKLFNEKYQRIVIDAVCQECGKIEVEFADI